MLNKTPIERNSSVPLRENRIKPIKLAINNQKQIQDTPKQEAEPIRIKTLAEIRAERNARCFKIKEEKDEAEVTSTSKEEILTKEATMDMSEPEQTIIPTCSSPPIRKIRLRRKLPVSDNVMSSSTGNLEFASTRSNIENPSIHEKLIRHNSSSSYTRQHREPHNEEKILDDALLLEEDDDDYEITLKAEEDLLKDIDDD